MFPRAGGQYVYLREAYNDFWAFLFGWTQFLVIQTGFIATVAIAFAKYLGVFVPGVGEDTVLKRFRCPEFFARFGERFINSIRPNWSPARLWRLLTWVNVRGVREGAWVQNLFTVLKVAAIVALIVAGLSAVAHSNHATFVPGWTPIPGQASLEIGCLAGLGAGRCRRLCSRMTRGTPLRLLPRKSRTRTQSGRALLTGSLVVTLLYLLINAAYLAVLPLDQVVHAKENRVAELAAAAIFGTFGAKLVVIGILISSFGCINGLILGGARVSYAMAREGLFFRGCARVSSRSTPATALWCQAGWAMLLSLTGSYSKLLTYTTFASVAFGGLMVAAVYRLRWTHPDVPRPYRCWGYPVTPAIYLLICVPFLIYVVQGDPVSTLIGAGLVLSGIPFYMVWKKNVKRDENV